MLAITYQRLAIGDPGQQGWDIGGGDYFQKGVGGVVFQPLHFAGGVVKGQADISTKLSDQGLVEAFFGRNAEVIFIAEMNQADDSPEVIDPVWVIERHAPSMRLRRKAPQK